MKAKRRTLSAPGVVLLLYVFVYSMSLFFAVIRDEDLSRIVASTYNLSYWFMGAMLISVRGQWNHERVAKPALYVILFMLFVAGVGYAWGHGGELSFRSAIGAALGGVQMPPLLEDSMSVNIFGYDFLEGGITVRAKILAPYPTAMAVLTVLLLALNLGGAARRNRELRYAALVTLAAAILVLLSRSRIGLVSLFLYVTLYSFSSMTAVVKRSQRPLLYYAAVVLMLMVVIWLSGILRGLYDDVIAYRASSSSQRFALYSASAARVLDEYPLYGFGVKHESMFPVPMGSHSTLVGTLYKTGLIGGVLLGFFLLLVAGRAIAVLFRSQRLFERSCAAVFLALLPFLAVEDIDAPQLVSFLWFFVVSVIINASDHPRVRRRREPGSRRSYEPKGGSTAGVTLRHGASA